MNKLLRASAWIDEKLARYRAPFFGRLVREASEREYWREDDHRWGRWSTTWFGFWLLAFFGRLRDAIRPGYFYKVKPRAYN